MAKKVTKDEKKPVSGVLATALAINKAYGDKILMAGDVIPEVQKFSIGTLSADFAICGGIPLGTMITFAGPSGGCKTLAAISAMAQYQKKFPDRVCIYVDAEHNLPFQLKTFARWTGLQTDAQHFQRLRCVGLPAEQIFKMVLELQDNDDIGLIVFDSVKALVPEIEYENDFDKDNGMRATVAKSLSKFCRMMLGPLEDKQNVCIMINHSIVEPIPGTRAFKYSEPCGTALNYFPSLKIRFLQRKFTCGTDLELTESKVQGEKGITPDGLVASFAITKSRFGGIDRSGGKLIFRYATGIDKATDIFEVATRNNIAKLEGTTWYLIDPNTGEAYSDEEGNPLKFVGKPKLLKYFQDNPDFVEEYTQAVNEYIGKTSMDISLLSEQDMAKIIKISGGLDRDVEEYNENDEKGEDLTTEVTEDEENEA